MKVKVIKFPVRYNGKTYRSGETFDMVEKYIDEKLVEKVIEPKKADKQKQEGDK